MIRFELELKNIHLKNFFTGLVFLGIQACANSEVAQKLSNSFDSPLETATTTDLIDDKKFVDDELITDSPVKSQVRKNLDANVRKKVDISQSQQVTPEKFTKESAKDKKKEVFFSPQPYRIIIRLSGANPSAPAETVTQALRNAGILFEVERIERFEKGSSSILKSNKR